ncbi:MAG: outer membrane lipoprotein chaperone LolA [Gammaproteobacteria bacterium]|nr:outer membrane lipoprotein chaperone LolA [Gammaproteobacteria bacterium]
MKLSSRLLLLLCLLASPAYAAAAATARDALKHFADSVHSLSAEFKQAQLDDKGQVTKTQSGRMWIARPGKFRWDYRQPYQQLIVSDGHKIWIYDPDLKQVTVRPVERALAGSPAALLSQRAALADAFALQDEGRDGDAQKLKLIPKSKDSDFAYIELWLADGVPQRMAFHDQLGDTTDISFSQITVNPAVDARRFDFTPPPGVDVVEGQVQDRD